MKEHQIWTQQQLTPVRLSKKCILKYYLFRWNVNVRNVVILTQHGKMSDNVDWGDVTSNNADSAKEV